MDTPSAIKASPSAGENGISARLRNARKTLTGPRHSVGSVLANRLGLQFVRIAAVNGAFRMRRRTVAPDIREIVEAYERDGVAVVENFLPADVFEQIPKSAARRTKPGSSSPSAWRTTSSWRNRSS
jgi:hypothetical protein